MNHKIQAVLFDLDGVLIDSLPVMRLAFEAAYRETVSDSEDIAVIEAFFKQYSQYLGYGFFAIMDKLNLPHAMQKPFVKYSREHIDGVRMYDGVQELLSTLHDAGYKLTIVTGKDGYRARELLDKLGIHKYFDIVTGSDEVDRPKPAPDMLLNQLKQLNISPQNAAILGDSAADIHAGKAAGTLAIAALWGYGHREDLGEADAFISEINHLADFLSSIQ